MASTGVLIRPCDIGTNFQLTGEEGLAWSKMLGFLKDPRERSLCIPDIFICPDCYTPVATADKKVVLCIVNGELRFAHADVAERIATDMWGPGSNFDEWRGTILAYCRDHLQQRASLVAGANAGLVASHPTTTRQPSKQSAEPAGVRPQLGRKRGFVFVG